jgi:cytidylate kinase
MSADADTNVVLAAYPYLYLYGGLEALFRYQEDDNNADRYGQSFGALIEDINNRDAKDSTSGELQLHNYAGGVV